MPVAGFVDRFIPGGRPNMRGETGVRDLSRATGGCGDPVDAENLTGPSLGGG